MRGIRGEFGILFRGALRKRAKLFVWLRNNYNEQ